MVPPDDAISNEKTLGVDYNFAPGDRYTKSDGIVAVGAAYPEVKAALELLDVIAPASLGIGLYKVNFLWPLEPSGILDFASSYDEVLVIEHKRAFVEAQPGRMLLNLNDAERLD